MPECESAAKGMLGRLLDLHPIDLRHVPSNTYFPTVCCMSVRVSVPEN